MSEAKTYSVMETAALIGISKSTLYQASRDGKADHLRPIRVLGSTRFPRAHIDRLLDSEAA